MGQVKSEWILSPTAPPVEVWFEILARPVKFATRLLDKIVGLATMCAALLLHAIQERLWWAILHEVGEPRHGRTHLLFDARSVVDFARP